MMPKTTTDANMNEMVVFTMYEKIVNAMAGGCLNLVKEIKAETTITFSSIAKTFCPSKN